MLYGVLVHVHVCTITFIYNIYANGKACVGIPLIYMQFCAVIKYSVIQLETSCHSC